MFVVCGWLFVVGHLSLVIGHLSLVIRRWVEGNWPGFLGVLEASGRGLGFSEMDVRGGRARGRGRKGGKQTASGSGSRPRPNHVLSGTFLVPF